MKLILTALLFIIYGYLPGANSCFKFQRMSGPWDSEKYNRNSHLYTKNGGCECGVGNIDSSILYVHVNLSYTLICTGTIIASNIVATSHWCLNTQDAIAVYDTWHPRPLHIHNGSVTVVGPSEVTLSRSRVPGSGQYKVKDMILNPRLVLAKAKQQPDYDLALLITEENLFEKGFTSICLPDGKVDVVHRPGYFYDVSLDATNPPKFLINEGENTVIMSGKECDKEGEEHMGSVDSTLCVRYAVSAFSTNAGGSLMVQSLGKNAKFLVGIADTVNVNPKMNSRYAYFTNVISLVKYVEHYASTFNSLWCKKSSELKLGAKMKPPPVPSEKPWQVVSKIKARDESLDCTCGIQHQVATNGRRKKRAAVGRISGGEAAKPYEFPWMVYTKFSFNQEYFSCGASLINNRMALIAAHCVIHVNKTATNPDQSVSQSEDAIAFVSMHETYNDSNAMELEVDHVYYHPQYVVSTLEGLTDSDIALVIFKKPVVFTSSKTGVSAKPKDLRPVCLPKRNQTFTVTGMNATVMGWGKTIPGNDDSFPKELQKLVVPILPKETCASISPGAKNVMTENVMCAGTLDPYKDHLQGDSGGGLVVDMNGKLTQVGIVSFGYDIFDEGKTIGGYVDVQKKDMLDFIDYYASVEGAKWCKS